MMLPNIYQKEKEFILKINTNVDEKLKELFSILKINYELESYDFLKKVTGIVMKEKVNDKLFLLWLQYVGEYIIKKYKTKWILRKRLGFDREYYFVPYLVNNENDLWRIGDECYTDYYNKQRMHNIGFELFYKLVIQRYGLKPKLGDKAFSKEYFIFID